MITLNIIVITMIMIIMMIILVNNPEMISRMRRGRKNSVFFTQIMPMLMTIIIMI